jgi:glycine reductase
MLGAMPFIGLAAGVSRVVRGVKIQHVCGDPNLPPEADRALRMRVVKTALRALETEVTEPTLFEPSEEESAERVTDPAAV